jgi:hypothetical protein
MTIRKRIVISGAAGATLTAIGLALVMTGGWGPCGPASDLGTVGGYLTIEHALFLFTSFPGLEGAAGQAGVPDWVWLVLLPWFDWTLAALSLSTLWSLVMPSRHGRHRPGICLTCGYNLTGNVSGRCPECGTGIKGQHGNREHQPRFEGRRKRSQPK